MAKLGKKTYLWHRFVIQKLRPIRIREMMMKKAMKKIVLFLFCTVVMTALTSFTTGDKNDIVGKWKLTSVTIIIESETLTFTPEEFCSIIEEDGDELIFDFKKDGALHINGRNESSYRYDGETLKINGDKVNVKKLTKTKLTIEVFDTDGSKMSFFFNKM